MKKIHYFLVTHKETDIKYIHSFSSQNEVAYFMVNNYSEYKMHLIP